MPFYLGAAGALRALEDPDRGLDWSRTDYGASPGRAADGTPWRRVTGRRRSWKLNWDYLSPDDASWLEAVGSDLVGGPVYFLDPLARNRLHPQIASAGFEQRITYPFSTDGSISVSEFTARPPVTVPIAGGITWSVASGGGALFSADAAPLPFRVPLVNPQESLIVSMWARSTTAGGVKAGYYWSAANTGNSDAVTEVLGSTVTLPANVWTEVFLVSTPPASAVVLFPHLRVPTGFGALSINTTGWMVRTTSGWPNGTWYPGAGTGAVLAEQPRLGYPVDDQRNANIVLHEIG